MMRPRRFTLPEDRGFTLIEVMIGLLLTAMTLVAGFSFLFAIRAGVVAEVDVYSQEMAQARIDGFFERSISEGKDAEEFEILLSRELRGYGASTETLIKAVGGVDWPTPEFDDVIYWGAEKDGLYLVMSRRSGGSGAAERKEYEKIVVDRSVRDIWIVHYDSLRSEWDWFALSEGEPLGNYDPFAVLLRREEGFPEDGQEEANALDRWVIVGEVDLFDEEDSFDE